MILPRALLLAAAVVLSVDTVAAPIQTNFGTGDGSIPGGAMPTANLLATNLLSASRSGTGDAFFYREESGYTVDLARLSDGQFGTAGGYQAFSVMPNVVSLTFNFNLATRPTGYDIASIKTYASWDSGRDGQAYTVQYSTAANPAQFSSLATVSRFDNTNFPQIPNPMYMPGGYNPMADYFLFQYNQAIANNDPMMAMVYWDMYNYELHNSMYGPQYFEDDSNSSTMVSLTDTSGVLASGVAALRFNFSGVENSGTAFREFVVEGVAGAAPTTISTTITASDTRVTGGDALQFQGGTLAPVGAVTLNLTSGIQVLASSTGTFDATSQDISSTGLVTISGSSLTLAGSTTSVISLSGAISGTGILINAAGNNVISGANTSGGLSITGGSLRIASAASLPATNNTVSTGGTLIIATNLNAAGAISVVGNGAAGQAGALVFETAVNSVNDTVITLTNDATLAVAGSREIMVRGAINATTAGKKLTVDTGAGFFLLDGGIGTNITQVEVKGAGDLLLRSNTTANYTVNAGATLVAERVAHFGAGAVIAAGGALRLGVGAGINQNFTQSVTISGTGAGSGAALELGWYNNDTLSGALTLAADATVLSHTANNVISGAITGATSGQKLTLVVDDLSLKLTGTTASSVAQVTKTGAGVLLIDTIGVINSGTVVVTTGLLANNGLINGVVTVASTGTLGGSGTIAGAVTVAGILAPGNSPGLLTQTTGDLNLTTGSHFLAELGGTTAGNGNGFHDQYFVSNGAINIANGVTLDVKSWLAADGITTFAPVRTNVFSLLKASNGIAGVFSDFTNADYSQWLLFDNSQLIHSPGNLYGTGLNGNQTFAAYGTTAARAAVGASLWSAAVTSSISSTTANPAGFIYAGSSTGAAAIGLLTAVDADAYLAALSPEAYLAAGDYALTIARSVSEAAFGQTSLLKTGSWTLGAGYNRAQHGYRGADAASNYELSGKTSLVTLTHDFGPHCSVGFFFGYNTGKTVANNANLDYRGNVFGLTSVGRYEGKRPVTLKAAVVASDIRVDAVRNGSTANDQTIRALSGQLTASLELYKEGRLTFSPLLGFVQGRSTSDAFAEAGSGARLNLNALERKSARGLAGLGATYILSNDLQLDVAFAYEYEFADAPTAVTASFVDAAATVPMTIEHALVDRSTTSGTLGANWKIDNSITLRLSAEARRNRELHKDYRYNVGLNVRF